MQKKLVLYEKTKLIFVQIINNTEDEKNVIYVNDIFVLKNNLGALCVFFTVSGTKHINKLAVRQPVVCSLR